MITQNEVLVNYLRGTGRTLTEAQAERQFGIKNLRARVLDLRNMGLVVNVEDGAYSIPSRDVNGSRAKIHFA